MVGSSLSGGECGTHAGMAVGERYIKIPDASLYLIRICEDHLREHGFWSNPTIKDWETYPHLKNSDEYHAAFILIVSFRFVCAG